MEDPNAGNNPSYNTLIEQSFSETVLLISCKLGAELYFRSM